MEKGKYEKAVEKMTDHEIKVKLMYLARYLDEGEHPTYWVWDAMFDVG